MLIAVSCMCRTQIILVISTYLCSSRGNVERKLRMHPMQGCDGVWLLQKETDMKYLVTPCCCCCCCSGQVLLEMIDGGFKGSGCSFWIIVKPSDARVLLLCWIRISPLNCRLHLVQLLRHICWHQWHFHSFLKRCDILNRCTKVGRRLVACVCILQLRNWMFKKWLWQSVKAPRAPGRGRSEYYIRKDLIRK